MRAPSWLKGEALRHFEAQAGYMDEVSALGLYGESDAALLAKMSVSYQKALEYLKAEQDARTPEEREKAQRMRLAEDRNYQAFAKMLRLDPVSKARSRRRMAASRRT